MFLKPFKKVARLGIPKGAFEPFKAEAKRLAKRIAFPLRKKKYPNNLSGKKVLMQKGNKIGPLSLKNATFSSLALPSIFIGNSIYSFLNALQLVRDYKLDSMKTPFHEPLPRLTSFEFRDIFRNNRPDSAIIDSLKKFYPKDSQLCFLPPDWLGLKITPRFLAKQLSTYQSLHSAGHKKVLEYFGFYKHNASFWLLGLLQERASSEIHSMELLPGKRGFRVTHILPLKLDQKHQKKCGIDVVPYSLTSEYAFDDDGNIDKVGELISGYILNKEVEENILKTLANPCSLDNENNFFLFFGGDRLTTLKMIKKIPLNPPCNVPFHEIDSNNESRLNKNFADLAADLTRDYKIYLQKNFPTFFDRVANFMRG